MASANLDAARTRVAEQIKIDILTSTQEDVSGQVTTPFATVQVDYGTSG